MKGQKPLESLPQLMNVRQGSKRNGTLDRREAFGNMLKRNKKGW